MYSTELLELEVQKLEAGNSPSRLVTAIVIGCGNRGQTYSNYGLNFPNRLKVVGAADPLEHRVKRLRKLHNITDDDLVTIF